MDNKRKFYEEQTRELVKSVTNFQEDEENFGLCLKFALDNFVSYPCLEVDPFKVKKHIAGFCEKFSVLVEYDKSRRLNDLATRYYEALGEENAHAKSIGYSVLALLEHLSGSVESYESVLKDENENESKEVDTSGQVNWAEYLNDEKFEPVSMSEDSSTWSESDEDSLESSLYLPYAPPPPLSADSGIEISPDGSSTSGYPPLFEPFQPYKKPEEEQKKSPVSRIPYWNPRYHVTKLEIKSEDGHTNFTSIWEKHLAEETPIYTPETNTVLNEAIVVRETLWMLHGLKDLYVFPWVEDHYEVLKHIHMKHITENTLREILSSLCDYGKKASAIFDFVNRVMPTNSDIRGHCHAYQAYSRGLLFFLDKYKAALSSYEKLIIDKEVITIIQLLPKIKPHLDELELLFNIHSKVLETMPENDHPWEHSTFLLDTLWKQLVEYSVWTRKKTTMQIVLFLFLTTLRPFINMLEIAIMRGQFTNSNTEFLIQRNETVGILDELFWNRAISFRELPKELEEQYFLKPLFTEILLASKSMEMLHNLYHQYEIQKFSDYMPDFLFTQFVESFQNQYLSHISQSSSSESCENVASTSVEDCKTPCDNNELSYHYKQLNAIKDKYVDVNKHWKLMKRTMDLIQTNSAVLLYSLLERTLLPCIENACRSTNKELIRFLKEKYNLMFHLSVMQRYFLMSSGDVMFAFYSEVFDRMLDSNCRVDVTFINNTLAEAISCVDIETSERLTLTLNELDQPMKNQPLTLLGLLNLSYDVGWPINVILDDESQQKYCQVFGFLLQIKCAKYCLDILYTQNLEEEVMNNPSKLNKWLSNEMPRNQKIHGMYIMRMRMLHFINGFHNYITRRSLHSSGVELNEKLEKAESLEDVLVAHQQYLSSLLVRCLFDPKLPYLREQILKLLSLALKFQSFWLAGVDKTSTEDLKTIETEFNSCINLLKSYLSKPLIRGKSIHLEDLACTIVTESHLEHIFL